MKPRQKHVDILPADSKGWGTCRGWGRIRQGTARGWGSVSPCLVSCFGRDKEGDPRLPRLGPVPSCLGTTPAPHPGAYGQLSVLVGTVAVTSPASGWPWKALCPRVPPKTTQQDTDTLATRSSPRPGRVSGAPGEKQRLACPKVPTVRGPSATARLVQFGPQGPPR